MEEIRDRNELNKRQEMAQHIIDVLRGKTGNNFQNAIYVVLSKYYSVNEKTFDMPQAMRGDYKNDGWVKEDKLFYMIYSPMIASSSFYKAIQNKLRSDLLGADNNPGLLGNVYEKGMWGGEVLEAILLVNTKDSRLPPNNTSEYEKIIEAAKEKYQIKFKCSVENLDFIEKKLNELDSGALRWIMFKLNMMRDTDYNQPNASDIISTIGLISKNTIENYTYGKVVDYNRISTRDKVNINKLDGIKDDIETVISKLSVVERAVKQMSQDVTSMEQFENTKNYVINTYIQNKEKYTGVELFDSIICDISKLFSDLDNHINEIKYLVVYIFDKCDIFEKEEKL